MRINFTECRETFAANTTLRSNYTWHGPLIGIERNPTSQITLEGCLRVCGTGTELYPWKDVSGVITTWILPVIGTLLQAPFESNAARRTILAITRWVGSPIASLSYVLWNIKVSAKAALMVDMAVKYDDAPGLGTDFDSMRDSMYLLLVMNQYTLKPTAMSKGLQKEAEGLLRITLFSKDLVLKDTEKTLRQVRRILAEEVREMRRRGAVPVFVSIMWFIFAFALSVQDAFGELGENSTAHDLALGCLLAWFPVLIMGSIVDRNPIAATAIRKKLCTLVDHVRNSLEDNDRRDKFIDTFKGQPDHQELKTWIENVAEKGTYMEGFFVEFAGQGRVRWHYGAAHPILSDIENCYIAAKGRNWLANEREARASLVLGPINDEGLVWFDIREFWQVLSAVIIVAGSCAGAFCLSYFTPTVGLGCRSGGYTIFFCVALGLLIVEMTVWLFLSPYEFKAPLLNRAGTRLQSHVTYNRLEDDAQERWGKLKRTASSLLDAAGSLIIRCVAAIALLFPCKDKDAVKTSVESACKRVLEDFRNMPPQRKWELLFFRPTETLNTIWLVGLSTLFIPTFLTDHREHKIYIVLAQVFGWYKTCYCVTSIWAGGGGYLDFSQQDVSNSKEWVMKWWSIGTVLTASVMALSMFYITVEWCQQSFISTEDYGEAMKGLRMTRRYRSLTFFVRRMSRAVLWATLDQLERFAMVTGVIRKSQKTLLWTKEHTHTWTPDIPHETASTSLGQHNASPSFELTDVDTGVRATPKMPQSRFPSTRNRRHESDASPNLLDPLGRPRNESDASLDPRSQPRPSDESSAPLIPQSRQAGAIHGRISGEGRMSFEAPFLEYEPRWRDMAYSGASHGRGNPDSGLLQEFEGDIGHGGLGLRFDDGDLERGR